MSILCLSPICRGETATLRLTSYLGQPHPRCSLFHSERYFLTVARWLRGLRGSWYLRSRKPTSIVEYPWSNKAKALHFRPPGSSPYLRDVSMSLLSLKRCIPLILQDRLKNSNRYASRDKHRYTPWDALTRGHEDNAEHLTAA